MIYLELIIKTINMKKDIFVILLVSIIWVCKPIPYETVAYRKYVIPFWKNRVKNKQV